MPVFGDTLPKFGSVTALACLLILKPTHGYSEAAFAFGQYKNGWTSGTAYNASTRAEARSWAMERCNARGYNCSIKLTFRDTCFAFAVQDGNSGAAWKTDSDLNYVQGFALGECVRMGLPCTIQKSFCDNVSEETVRAAQQEAWNQFQRRWNECFATPEFSVDVQKLLEACDQALTYPALADTDRPRLMQQRDSLVSLQQKQRRIAYEGFLRHWQECFAAVQYSADAQNHIQACDHALSYATDGTDRSRLMQQHESLVSLQPQVPPQHTDNNKDNPQPASTQPQLSPLERVRPTSIHDAISRLTDLISRFTPDKEFIAKALFLFLGAAALFAMLYELYKRSRAGQENSVPPSPGEGPDVPPLPLRIQALLFGLLSRGSRAIETDNLDSGNGTRQPGSQVRSARDNGKIVKEGILGKLVKLVANGPTFVILYIFFMIPTYILPYLGSNSGALNTLGYSGGKGFNPALWYHLISLGVLCLLAWARGSYTAKIWLVIFPILALIFDMVPTLNLVPFVPTVMHLCAVIIGVSSQKKYIPAR